MQQLCVLRGLCGKCFGSRLSPELRLVARYVPGLKYRRKWSSVTAVISR